jgi:hypothetical protein
MHIRRKILLLTLAFAVTVGFIIVFSSCNRKVVDTTPSSNATLEELHEKYKDNPELFEAAVQASHLGITIEEVQIRSYIVDAFRGLDAELENNEPETFAGLWIQQVPNFCIVMAFTHNGEGIIKQYVSENLARYVEIRTVKYSFIELQEARAVVESFLRTEKLPFDSGINIMKNLVEIRVTDRRTIDAAIRYGNLIVPDCVDITVRSLAVPQ